MGLMNVLKTLRNNWKKTVFFGGLLAYGADYSKKKYQDSLLRTAYCLQAKKYGDMPIRTGERPRRVTVFLNPATRKGKGKSLYDKNVAPVLNMAGLEVTVIRTEFAGQAKKFMDVLDETDAIVIAGGDGTVSESEFAKVPIAVIPMGYTNTLAGTLLPEALTDVGAMLEAALSVVCGSTKPVDVLKIEADEGKTVFTPTCLEWGGYTDARMRQKKYWYFVSSLKKYWTYVWTTVRYWPVGVQAHLTYTEPCAGCSSCYKPPPKPTWKWWHFFTPPQREVPQKDFSDVINEDCGVEHEEVVDTVQFTVSAHSNAKEVPSATVEIGPQTMSKTEFIKEGWRHIKEGSSELRDLKKISTCRFSLKPVIEEDAKERWYVVDSEQFEVLPITVELLPKKLQVFFRDTVSVKQPPPVLPS